MVKVEFTFANKDFKKMMQNKKLFKTIQCKDFWMNLMLLNVLRFILTCLCKIY